MNQIAETIFLRKFMEGEDGWGHEEGETVGRRILSRIESMGDVVVVRISLKGVRRTDASFPRESVIEVARCYRKAKGFCLVDVPSKDLLDNWEAAAMKKEQPVLVWETTGWRLIGPKLTDSLKGLFEFVASTGTATTSEIAAGLELNVPNASNQLKKLWDSGYVMRRERVASTGGIEFEYFVPR